MKTLLPLLLSVSLLGCGSEAAAPASPETSSRAASAEATPAAPVIEETSLAVVTGLYRDYAWETAGGEANESRNSLAAESRPVLERYFDDAMTALILKDQECTSRTGEICNLDFVPVWASQDPTGATPRIAATAKPETVEVQLDSPGAESQKLTYSMAATPRGWRIADIGYGEGQTLRGLLSQ